MFELLHSPKTGDLIQALPATSLSLANSELSATCRQACVAFCYGAPQRAIQADGQAHRLRLRQRYHAAVELTLTDARLQLASRR
jgi:hypothetical protein